MKINYGDKRWASAFLDGEGCIKYYKRLKANRVGKVYKSTIIRIEVCGTDYAPIRFLYKLFGGVIYKRKRRLTEKGRWAKPQEMWTVYHKKAYKVCKTVLPYLLTKQRIKSAQQIIKYYDEGMNINRGRRIGV